MLKINFNRKIFLLLSASVIFTVLFGLSVSADINLTGNLLLMHLNELSANSAPGGNDAEDSSGYGYHGIEYGNVTFGVPGKFATAFGFDGVNDYLKTGLTYNFAGKSKMTIEMWIKPGRDYTEETKRIFLSHKGYGKPFELSLDESSDSLSFKVVNSIGSFYAKEPADSYLYKDTWYHIAAVVNGTNLLLYRNGVLTASGKFSGTFRGGTDNLIIGSKTSSNFFKGAIDEVLVYNRSLSSQEVLEHYNQGVAPPVCGNGIIEAGELCDSNSQSCAIGGYSGSQQCNAGCNGFQLCTATEFCGDGVINGVEQCDGTNLNGQSCVSLGYISGSLSCNIGACQFDTSSCANASVPTPPTVEIFEPTNSAYASSSVSLRYSAADDTGISACTYELDGVSAPLPGCGNTTLASLALGSHQVRVSATDNEGSIGQSPLVTFTVTADTTQPSWSPIPVSQFVIEGQPLSYDVNAVDNVAIASYSISDTTNFRINAATGLLENNLPLVAGNYPLTIYVNDLSGNINSAAITIFVFALGATTANLKVAFIGDQGINSNAAAVLQLIKDEGTDIVLHQGDLAYSSDVDAWDQQINNVLGNDFPYFASVGNHDTSTWAAYQQKLQERINRIPGVNCTGDLGVQSSCTYRGLFFILSGVGTMGSGHDTYIRNQLSQDNSIWSICSWHKTMQKMQIGGYGDSTGWAVYEECRKGGALIAAAHEHSYERTKTLVNMTNQIVDPTWPEPNNVRVTENATFAFISGLGGSSIRDQQRCLPYTYPYGCNGEWASIYTSNQGANYGALFCTFNVNGNPNIANCYFKDISGVVPDRFNITRTYPVVIPNTPPVVSASYLLPYIAQLNGTVSDNGGFTTLWSKVSGPGTVTFDDSTSVNTIARFSLPGTYVLRLTADDNEYQSSSDVTVTIYYCSAP